MCRIRDFSSAVLSISLPLVFVPAATAAADEPLDVFAEMAKIAAQHRDAVGKGRGNSAEIRAADMVRLDAIAKLVKQAEESKSQDYLPLALAYQQLERFDDAVRWARAAVNQRKDSVTYSVLVNSLQRGGKLKEAEETLAEAKAALGEESDFSGLHEMVAAGYQRAGRHLEASEHMAESVYSLGRSVLRLPNFFTDRFKSQVAHLPSAAVQAKSADKILPIVEKLENQLAAKAGENPKVESSLAALRTAKVQTLAAVGDLGAAVKAADELAEAAEKRLAADPKDFAALEQILEAKQIRARGAAAGVSAAKAHDDLDRFIDEHWQTMSGSAKFIRAADFATRARVYRLMNENQFDEAAKAIHRWLVRLERLNPVGGTAKKAAADAMRSVNSLRNFLESRKKQAAPTR
jgi:hypothetical protein